MATEHNSVALVDGDVVRQFARAALLAALLGAAAPVSIPIPLSAAPPITLQVLFVFLAGLVLGPVWGPISLLLYLAAGAIGLPVFSGMSAGLGVLVGNTAGYLWSYPLAAGLIGLVIHRDTELRDPAAVSLPVVIVALVAGTILIYGMGTGYMAWLLEIGAWEAITLGALPFIPGELLKIAAAIAIVKSGRIGPVRS
ncbi:biotin transporter BioY [Natronorubrum aibiense]|uniref:Biotin transporter BioY n=1 Tax=Natronorubrum aibiense TaxID=348826 RepID=A0A5P9NZP2_9EURY|nr:biotin transporter BioY [Natronorubrum aibiense]QFU81354.1 biotin transporter BioY [Natronorubrum aibiense]